jgi:NADH-quinone oxidoreductase subunit L
MTFSNMALYVLIPLVPLLAAAVLGIWGRRFGEASHKVGVPAAVLSFALSIVAFADVLSNGPRTISLYRLLESGDLRINLALYADQLTVLLLLLVTGVSAIVHIYSSRYMIGDPRYSRFFAVIGLFTASMVMLVMSGNLLMTYMCWEAMGICSYLLISHWAQRKAAGRAATKAFLVNAVADVGLGLGVILTFQTFGTLDIREILERAPAMAGQTINLLAWAGMDAPVQTVTLISLLLFTGAVGKSAQVPFHVWLPFAMEAPTPVSALIHAATMVNAGPFLLVRFSPLLLLAPAAMAVIAVVGGVTALFAAFVSLTQTDIKKTLAYSTISQIGFMIMTCGVGAFVAAVFHLLAHGFLKGFLFLSAGNALEAGASHQSHGGGEAHGSKRSPGVAALAGALLFACIPPLILFSGPYEAMWIVHGAPAARIAFWVIALATCFFTAMYLFRGAASLFSGRFAASGSIIRPRFFSAPHLLVALMLPAVLFAFIFGFGSWFTAFLAPALGRSAVPAPQVSGWLLLPFVAAAGGWAVAWLYNRAPATEAKPALLKRLYVLFLNKWYFDEIYQAYFVAPNLRFAGWLARVLEGGLIERLVRAAATSSVATGRWLWRVPEGRALQTGVDRLAGTADAVGRLFQRAEVHTLQEHLLLVVGGLAGTLGLFYLLVFGG